jgi:hypothetical protein
MKAPKVLFRYMQKNNVTYTHEDENTRSISYMYEDQKTI